jgi:DNA primase catalytic subunit
MDKSTTLQLYKREDIQKAIIENAQNREIAIKFGESGFGKRPDTLKYPKDILELAKQGATSFHASEELWRNPLQLDPMMKKADIEKLRIGWDIVLDIDCPIWKLAKITTWLIIRALKDHNITSISLKFSGNKGFHIGVPFEDFPESINNQETKNLFPEAPRNIASYLLDYINSNYIKVEKDEKIIFGEKFRITFQTLAEATKKDMNDLTTKHCSNCNKVIKGEKQKTTEFVCKKCGSTITSNAPFMKCAKCKILMEKFEHNKSLCKCGSNNYYRHFNPSSIIEVDTILISSRHLYRMPYSLNEKSGLISLPIDPEKVLSFEKQMANPKNIKLPKFKFLDKENIKKDEAKSLLEKAFAFNAEKQKEYEEKSEKKFQALTEALPEKFFPPCIQNILKGLEDGRKRSLFLLTNFLTSVGWDYERIDELFKKWNEKNTEPLREVLIKGQLRYHKQKKKKILPPNCQNKMYYIDMRICTPDNLCKKIKNPVNYSIVKTKYLNKK